MGNNTKRKSISFFFILLMISLPVYTSSVFAEMNVNQKYVRQPLLGTGGDEDGEDLKQISMWTGVPAGEGIEYHLESSFTPNKKSIVTWIYDLPNFKLNVGETYSISGSSNDILSITNNPKGGTFTARAGKTYYVYAFPVPSTAGIPTITWEYIVPPAEPSDMIDGAGVPDPGAACAGMTEKGEWYVDWLESGTIQTLESILRYMYGICIAMSAIETLLSTINIITGSDKCQQAPDCHLPGWLSWLCVIIACSHKLFGKIYEPFTNTGIKNLCWFVSCGYCSDFVGGLTGSEAAKEAVSPWSNVIIAGFCLCPGGIMFNLRKLKIIYDTRNACVESACTQAAGSGPEGCENQFSEAVCQYWWGAYYSLIMGLVSLFIKAAVKVVVKSITKAMMGETPYKSAWNLVEVPLMILQVKYAWDMITYEFSDPKPEDFKFAGGQRSYESLQDYPIYAGPNGGTYRTTPFGTVETINPEGEWQEVNNLNPEDITKTDSGYAENPKDPDPAGAAADIAWAVLDHFMGEWAYGYVGGICKENTDSSEPLSETTEGSTAHYLGVAVEGPCSEYKTTVVHAGLTKTEQETDAGKVYSYGVSSTVTSCNEAVGDVDYNVFLLGDGSRGVFSGTAAYGEVTEASETVTSPYDYWEVCISTAFSDTSIGDEGIICFPAPSRRGDQISGAE